MIPQQPGIEGIFEIPKFDVNPEDVEDFAEQLKGFHEVFYDCFHRSESRRHFFHYMAGQFAPLERKSIEPIAIAVEKGKVRVMQRFVSDEALYKRYTLHNRSSLPKNSCFPALLIQPNALNLRNIHRNSPFALPRWSSLSP